MTSELTGDAIVVGSQSVLSELLDAFRAGEGVDLVRDALPLMMQRLIENEATEQIGAARAPGGTRGAG